MLAKRRLMASSSFTTPGRRLSSQAPAPRSAATVAFDRGSWIHAATVSPPRASATMTANWGIPLAKLCVPSRGAMIQVKTSSAMLSRSSGCFSQPSSPAAREPGSRAVRRSVNAFSAAKSAAVAKSPWEPLGVMSAAVILRKRGSISASAVSRMIAATRPGSTAAVMENDSPTIALLSRHEERALGRRHTPMREAGQIGGLEPHAHMGMTVVVLALQDLAAPVEPSERRAVRERDGDLNDIPTLGKPLIESGLQSLDPLPGYRRRRDEGMIASGGRFAKGNPLVFRKKIDLVEELDQPRIDELSQSELLEDAIDVVPLGFRIGMRDISNMDDDIRFQHLLERGAERRHELGREIGNEADGIRKDDLPARGQLDGAHRRIERREQQILGKDSGVREPIEERRLPGIGVADECDHRVGDAPARVSVQFPCPNHAFQFSLELGDALADQAPVDFDLAFARPAQESEAAALPLQMGPASHQSAALIGEVRKLDLKPSLAGTGPLPENLQDQSRAVDDLAVKRALQIALLDRAQPAIHDDDPNRQVSDETGQAVHRAGPEEAAWASLRQADHFRVNDLQQDRRCQPDRLGEPRFGRAAGILLAPHGRMKHESAARRAAPIAVPLRRVPILLRYPQFRPRRPPCPARRAGSGPSALPSISRACKQAANGDLAAAVPRNCRTT